MDHQAKYNHIVEQMLAFVGNKTTDQAEAIMTVPSKSYTDPVIWQKEIDRIFHRVPIVVGLSAEIPKPNDFKTIDIAGKPLLITRQDDGTARVLLNVCAHRETLVAQAERGNQSAFTCQYHGWTYNKDGRLRGILEPGKFGCVERDDLALTDLPTYEKAGLIFAVLTPGLQSNFEEFAGEMIDDLSRLKLDDWVYAGKREFVGANWKIAYDGYLEGYHFATAHAKTLAFRSYSNVTHFTAHGPHMIIGFPQLTLEKLNAVDPSELWKHENDGYDYVRTLFPNSSIFSAPEITQIAQILPGPTPLENRTIMNYLVRKPPANEAEKKSTEETMDFFSKLTYEEDYILGLQVQHGLLSGAKKEVIFGRNEKGNQYFHRWINWYLADDMKSAAPTL